MLIFLYTKKGSARDNTTASNNQHVAKNNHVATTPSASSHVLATCSSCGSCNSIQLVHVAADSNDGSNIVNSSSGPQQQSKMTTEYDEGIIQSVQIRAKFS